MTDGLPEWLRAQFDEDERIVRGCSGTEWWEHPKNWVSAPPLNRVALVVHDGDRAHIIRHDPSRVLREIDAKRGVLRQYEDVREQVRNPVSAENRQAARIEQGALGDVMRLLALPYADRPGYDEAWRP
jgi:hypothetical protein